MRAALIGFGIVATVVAIVVVVGWFLPKDHVAARRVHFHQPVDAVFAVITDFAAGASWRPLKSVELLPPRAGKPSFREEGAHGALTYLVEELAPPRKLVTRIVDNAAFGGTWTYELTPEAAGCQLAITERGEVYNPIFRFVGHFFLSQTATIEAYLAALGAKLGESVTPENVP
jgi:hypothetical protein